MTSHDLPASDGPRAGRPKRRHFSAAYKLRMVEEYDAAQHGEKGALLRREGLYDSSIQLWRRQRDAGELTESGPASAPRKSKSSDTRPHEIHALARAVWSRSSARAQSLVNR